MFNYLANAPSARPHLCIFAMHLLQHLLIVLQRHTLNAVLEDVSSDIFLLQEIRAENLWQLPVRAVHLPDESI